jgi:hypothetical protein
MRKGIDPCIGTIGTKIELGGFMHYICILGL